MGTITAAAITAGGISLFEGTEKSIDESGARLNFARKTGSRKAFEKTAQMAEARVKELKDEDTILDIVSLMGGTVGFAFDQLIREPIQETEVKSQEQIAEQAREALMQSDEELKAAAKEHLAAARELRGAAQAISSGGGTSGDKSPNRSDSPTSPS